MSVAPCSSLQLLQLPARVSEASQQQELLIQQAELLRNVFELQEEQARAKEEREVASRERTANKAASEAARRG